MSEGYSGQVAPPVLGRKCWADGDRTEGHNLNVSDVNGSPWGLMDRIAVKGYLE